MRDWRAQSALNLLVRALLLQFLCSTEQGRARCGRLSTPQTALVMSCLSPRNNNKTSSSSQTIITMITTIASDRITCAVSSRLSLLSAASLLRAGPASRGAPDNPKNAGLGWQNNDNSLITHHHHHDRNHHIKSHHSQCLVSPCFPTQMTQTNALSLFPDTPTLTL